MRVGRAVPCKVVGRGAQHAVDVADLAHDQGRIGERRHADGHVDCLGEQIDEIVGQPQADVDLGMLGPEPRHQRRDHPAPQPQRRRHLERALRRRPAACHARLGPLDRVAHLQAGFVEGPPLLGQRQLARRPDEQRAARGGAPAPGSGS